MEEMEMAYIAGLIDGDGSISLHKVHRKAETSIGYTPAIQLSKSKPVLQQYLLSKFGGYALVVQRPTKNVIEYKWKLERSNQCKPFLQNITPYLIIKKQQAQKLLDYIEKNPFERGQKLTSDQLDMRNKYVNEIRELNALRDNEPKRFIIKAFIEKSYFWAYLAGIIDTDGSFSIKKESRGTYSPTIQLSLISFDAMEFIKNHCDYGNHFVVNSPRLKQGFYYRFGVYNRDEIIQVINNILPFLLHKKEAAEMLLEFCKGFVAQGGKYLKTTEQSDFRENCYQKLCAINRSVLIR